MILVYGDSKYHIIVHMLISHHIWPLTSIKPVVTGGFKHSEYAGPPQSECINLFPLVGGSAHYSSCQTDSVTQKNILITFNLKHSRVWETCESCSFIKWRIRDILTYPTTHTCSIRGSSRLCLWQIHFRYAKLCFSSFPASQLWFRAFCTVWV